jgi:hypothetical protein
MAKRYLVDWSWYTFDSAQIDVIDEKRKFVGRTGEPCEGSHEDPYKLENYLLTIYTRPHRTNYSSK